MVASRQVEIPFYRGIGRRGRRFGALAQVTKEPLFHFCVNKSFQLQNASVLTCWNLLLQKLQRLLVVEIITRQMQRLWEDKRWENSWVAVAEKRLQAESFQQNLQNKQSVAERQFYKHFSLIRSSNFRYQPLGQFLEILEGKPSSWWCLVVPRTRNSSDYLTRWKLHIVWISNTLELLCWCETNVLAIETEICQWSWLQYLQYQRK